MSAKLTKDEFIDRLASLTNNIVAIDDYNGMTTAEAHRQTGINNISACITGTYKTAGGFLWENEKSLIKKSN